MSAMQKVIGLTASHFLLSVKWNFYTGIYHSHHLWVEELLIGCRYIAFLPIGFKLGILSLRVNLFRVSLGAPANSLI